MHEISSVYFPHDVNKFCFVSILVLVFLSRIHKTQQDTEGTKCFPPVSRGRLFLSIAGIIYIRKETSDIDSFLLEAMDVDRKNKNRTFYLNLMLGPW